ncbi:MAG: aminotransferase class I/II-fold pyridoxal phosphate-dependent enzyme [Calditrichaeota bacterium]|nr:MAG: aminotransferase class I/II-fold pyridoxal phosphate-dependent enzyme [Calditrichota bacterium]
MAQQFFVRQRHGFVKSNKNHTPAINLNLNVRGLAQSATLEINERSARLKQEGRRVYKLGLGQSPFPVPQVVVDELKANAHQKDYLPVKGLPELRQAVAEYYYRTQGLEHEAGDVLIGPGSKELMFILQLVYYGDLVIPTPSWVSYAPQAQIIGRPIRWLQTHQTHEWHLTPEEMEKLCKEDPARPRLIILNYPSNPTGRSYRLEELKRIARVARQYRVILLSDEIYGELNHAGRHISIARFYPEGTIISSGLSKWCGAGGWRLGTFIFPKSLHWLLEAMSVVASETFTATSAPIQYAAVRAFQGGSEIEHYLWQSRRILRALGRFLAARLRAAGAVVVEPKGAFYLFPDFCPFREKLQARGINTSTEMCQQLLEDTGVAVLPGTVFGRDEKELTARIAYVDFDGAQAIAAAEQIPPQKILDEDFLLKYCNRTVTAINRICDWLGSL